MSRMSVAFATHREAIMAELQQLVEKEILPSFNAEIEDIRRKHEDERNNTKVGATLADHRRRARYEDIRVRRKQFIDTLQTRLMLEMEAKVQHYNGLFEESVDKEDKPLKIIKFPDGSTARMPRGLWVNYKMFDHPW